MAHVEKGSFNALAAPSIASTEIKRAARIDMPKNHESWNLNSSRKQVMFALMTAIRARLRAPPWNRST